MVDGNSDNVSSDTVALGGNIELSGFRDIPSASMSVLRKIVGTYARRFSEICKQFEKLSLHMKKVNEGEHSEKYEVHASVLDKGSLLTASNTDRNLFFAVDTALKRVESEILK